MNCSQNKITNITDLTQTGLHDMTQKQCRICLETDNNNYIEPCQCSGTLQHVHFRCMAKWIRHSNPSLLARKQQAYEHVCEMCKDTIVFQCQESHACTSGKQFVEKVKSRVSITVGLIVVTLVCLCLLVGGAIMTNKQDPTDGRQALTFIILISCTLIMAILLLVLLYVWVTDYCIRIQRKVSKIPNIGRRSITKVANTVQIHRIQPEPQNMPRLVNSRSMGSRMSIFPEFYVSNLE